MNALLHHIFIAPDNDFTLTNDGWAANQSFDRHRRLSVTGMVTRMGSPRFNHFHKFGHNFPTSQTDEDIDFESVDFGMEYDVPVEIAVGDRVMFKYLHRMPMPGEDLNIQRIVVPYHDIYAVVRGDKLSPLNGMLIIEMLNDFGIEDGIQVRDKRESLQFARVLACGCLVRRYLDHPEERGDLDFVREGDIVAVRHSMTYLMEVGEYAEFSTGNPIRRTHRKNIVAVFRGDSIEKM